MIDAPYAVIPLTRGEFALVDVGDAERIRRFKWYVRSSGSGKKYAIRTDRSGQNGPQYSLQMHREIMGLRKGDSISVDHIDPDKTLDNRRSNLRLATQAQNSKNKNVFKNNTSGFKGVSFHRRSGKYRARIGVGMKLIHLGMRDTARAAYLELYVPAAIHLHGEFARVPILSN